MRPGPKGADIQRPRLASVDTGPQVDRHGEDVSCEGTVLPFPHSGSPTLPALATAILERCLAEWEHEEAVGPHVVIAYGEDARCFGPFASRALAVGAATAEALEWAREFPDAEVSFQVAPLLDVRRIAPHLQS